VNDNAGTNENIIFRIKFRVIDDSLWGNEKPVGQMGKIHTALVRWRKK
jgi:hypothetical protein